MKEIMDGFEGVSAKLQEGVDRAIAGAKSALEKAKPYIEDGVEIGNDTEICQNVTIKSGTKIGSE